MLTNYSEEKMTGQVLYTKVFGLMKHVLTMVATIDHVAGQALVERSFRCFSFPRGYLNPGTPCGAANLANCDKMHPSIFRFLRNSLDGFT